MLKNNKLKQKLLVLVLFGTFLPLQADILYYKHPELRLNFTLNTETKEASLGTGLDQNEQNAIALPVLGDPWWNESPTTNYWKELEIPSTIVCSGAAYSSDGNVTTISQDTYTVTTVANYAFYKSTRIQSIKLPETIKEIGDAAFYWCVNLKTINIPSQVSYISNSLFTWCNQLETILLPEHISYIGSSAFSDCISLKEINIPGECKSVGIEAFKNCSSLEVLNIENGDSPLKLGYCYSMGLNSESSEPSHYRGMFSDCPVKKLHVGRDIEFESENINGWYPPFMEYFYKGVGSNNKDIWIQSGKIYDEVTFGDNVTVIPAQMFQYATIKSQIVLPSQLKTIGEEAFAARSGTDGTLSQSALVFPASLESIGKYAFDNCINLSSITCEGVTPPIIPDKTYYDAFQGCSITFFVPKGGRPIYLAAENWSKYRIIEQTETVVTINVKTAGSLLDRLVAQDYQLDNILRLKLKGSLNDDDWANIKKMTVLYDLDISEIDMEVIPESLFKGSSLTYIKLPNNLRIISDEAFYRSNLTGILDIPATCTEIGKYAFDRTGITGLSYNGTLHISDYAFSHCANLEDVYIQGEGTVVDQYAFSFGGLKKITIGKGVTLGESVVCLCENLEEVVLEDGVKSIGAYCFGSNIKKISFEGFVEEIGKYAFTINSLQEINILDIRKWCQLTFTDSDGLSTHPLYNSSGKTNVHLYYNGEELTDIEIPEGTTTINEYAFSGCDKLTSVKINKDLTTIGKGAFSYCTQLNDVQLPSGLVNIDSYAFQNSALKSIDLPESLGAIGKYAFYKCNELSEIKAHWRNPISIDYTMFNSIDANCTLYIPIGTASKYSNAGWSGIPNIRAVGILSARSNRGGSVICDAYSASVTDGIEQIPFTPYKSFHVEFEAESGFRLLFVKLNQENVTSELVDGKLFIEEPEENLLLEAFFVDASVEQGDADGNHVIDRMDIVKTANSILNIYQDDFYDYWADMDGNGVLNITDIILIISKINNQ